MIPDKIYIQEQDGKTITLNKVHDTDIEYISKGALLEWAKKELEFLSWYYEKIGHVTGNVGRNETWGKIDECEKLIKYLESL